MATSLTAFVHCGLRCRYTVIGELEEPAAVFDEADPVRYAFGTGAQKGDLFWSDRRSIAASSSHTLDVRGTLANQLGETCAFAKIKALFLRADAANAHNINIGNGANPWLGLLVAANDLLKLQPGTKMCFENPAGWAIAGGTDDDLMFANAGGASTVFYDIAILGESA